MRTNPIRVALVYDLDFWILGAIARHMAEQFASRPDLLIAETMGPPANYRRLRAILKQFDVVHFLSIWDCFRFARYCDKAVITSVYHLDPREVEYLRQHLNYIDSICYYNRAVLAQLADVLGPCPLPISKVMPGLATDRFKPNPDGRRRLIERFGFGDDVLALGLAAKPTSNALDRKGFDRYWQLLERLLPSIGDRLKLVVFGPTGEGGWKPEDIPGHLRAHVEISGYLPDEEYSVYISGLDYYICLSRLEGIPYPVLEAMACGVKTISTSVGVVPDVIKDNVNGYVVTEENYLDRIKGIIDSNFAADSAPLRAAARQSVERYAWPAAVDSEWYHYIYDGARRWKQSVSRYELWRRNLSRTLKIIRQTCGR
ncbi:glycosyltransferase family 4 protein [bacterium]|nr:glycosyltransferase family 4 protein [bacterium]